MQKTKNGLVTAANVHLIFLAGGAGAIKAALSGCGKNSPDHAILYWDDFYSFGPIFRIHEEQGLLARERWLGERFKGEWNRALRDRGHRLDRILKLLAELPEDRRVYLWCGENAHEQISVRIAAHALQSKNNDVYIMNVTQMHEELADNPEPESVPRYAGHANADLLKTMLSRIDRVEPANREIREAWVEDWNRLCLGSDTLRIWQNGKITSLEEHAFDDAIIKTVERLQYSEDPEFVEDGYVKAGKVLSELAQLQLFDSDPYFEYRFWHLISIARLEFKGIPYAPYLYHVKIREI